MTCFEPLSIPITTLTPIWTGDADMEMTYPKATSFMGGLRFWTEALLRAQGRAVCNINRTEGEDKRCVYDPKKPDLICDACKIFGCTGLGRSFRMQIVNDKNMKHFQNVKVVLSELSYIINNKTKTPEWPLQKKNGMVGKMTLQITSLRPRNLSKEIHVALHLIIHWGTLGALDQYGYGVVTADTKDLDLSTDNANSVDAMHNDINGPSLCDFFFFHGQNKFESEKTPFLIRAHTRSALRKAPADKPLRHYFCGSLQKTQNIGGTRFNIAALDDGTMTGWGYFPRTGAYHAERDRCLDALCANFTSHCTQGTVHWKEYQSSRDNCGSAGEWDAFLRELIENPWR